MADLSPWHGPHNDHLRDADSDPTHCGACGTRNPGCEIGHCRYGLVARARAKARRDAKWWRRLARVLWA